MSKHSPFRIKARLGLTLLIEQFAYTQIDIFKKLKALDIDLSKSSISNIWTEKQSVSIQIWKKAATGIEKILLIEQGLVYVEEKEAYELKPNHKKRKIASIPSTHDSPSAIPKPNFIIHDGRLDVSQKVAFYRQAQEEVIEVGLRLRNFKNYFSDKRETAFADPIRTLLDQGINFKCFVLDPEGFFSQRYFADRAHAQPQEKINAEKSKRILLELENHCREINREGYEGRLQLFTYDHFPYYHATVVDGDTANGQLILSSYLYGVSRANSPVMQLSRKTNKILFKKYWTSVKALTTHQISNRLA